MLETSSKACMCPRKTASSRIFIRLRPPVPRLRSPRDISAGCLNEVSLVKPGMVIFFGDKLLRQALEVPGDLNADGGAPENSPASVRRRSMILTRCCGTSGSKVITWKIHIPRCGFFNSAL